MSKRAPIWKYKLYNNLMKCLYMIMAFFLNQI